jgi:hypothetical protein
MKYLRYMLLTLLVGPLTSCTQNGAGPVAPGTPPIAQPGPNSVAGVAIDTQGRPIAGAKVWIEPAVTTGLVEVTTDVNGHYLVTDLPTVPYYAKAWTEVDYGGQRYCLRLGMLTPSDFDAFTAEAGVIRNFQWQLSGVIEDLRDYNGYFGGEIRLFLDGDMRGGVVELTFTPTGPLIDGSTGQTLMRTLNVNEEVMVYDIPVGTYRVTSVLLENGVRTPLKTGIESSWDGYPGQTEAADLAFTPLSCGNGNGTDRAFLYLSSPYSF